MPRFFDVRKHIVWVTFIHDFLNVVQVRFPMESMTLQIQERYRHSSFFVHCVHPRVKYCCTFKWATSVFQIIYSGCCLIKLELPQMNDQLKPFH